MLLEGGSETSSSVLQTFVLAMVMFPDAQRKAQDEIDRVVGPDRTPRIEDMENLPYVRALVDEVIVLERKCGKSGSKVIHPGPSFSPSCTYVNSPHLY
jgi:hypothetical protein